MGQLLYRYFIYALIVLSYLRVNSYALVPFPLYSSQADTAQIQRHLAREFTKSIKISYSDNVACPGDEKFGELSGIVVLPSNSSFNASVMDWNQAIPN